MKGLPLSALMHSLIISMLFGAAQALLVPGPPGPYSVAVRQIELIDPSRVDLLAPQPNTRRRFMASAYLPLHAHHRCQSEVVPYMPALTAKVFTKLGESLGLPDDLLGKFDMEFCNLSTVKAGGSHHSKNRQFPVAVFSPGYAGTRLIYGGLARSLASLGYIVIAVDHTHEAAVVEFPDGTAAYQQPSLALNSTSIPLLLEVGPTSQAIANTQQTRIRTGDVSHLISQLSNATVTDHLLAKFPGSFDPNRIVVYGHSFGGATAADAALRDPRVVGGINYDGSLFGYVKQVGINDHQKPFVLVSRATDPANVFTNFYDKIDGPKLDLVVEKTQHYGFTDVLLLLTVYKIPARLESTVHDIFGTLNGRKLEKAVNQITGALLEALFEKRWKPLRQLGRNDDIKVLHRDL